MSKQPPLSRGSLLKEIERSDREWSRRRFLAFMGRASSTALVSSPLAIWGLGCQPNKPQGYPTVSPSPKDELLLAQGLQHEVLIRWNETINSRGERFGFNNDYLAFQAVQGSSEDLLLWVNHEYVNPLFLHGQMPKKEGKRDPKQVESEMQACGGSIVRIKKSNGSWKFQPGAAENRRISGRTPIPLVTERPIQGATTAIGTFGNCAGGVTPWGTILTCEENTNQAFGTRKNGKSKISRKKAWDRWYTVYDYPPEHYGWVVEVNLFSGKAQKLTSMGRFRHESATVAVASDGRPVVYSGDDKAGQCLYKFISDRKDSLTSGTLYVADTVNGRWIPLTRKHPKLRKAFRDQTELLIHTPLAAKLVGGTPLDRPEDIEIDPKTGAVYLTLTNNKKKGNFHGSILKIVEKNGDRHSLEFESDIFLAGGPEQGFSSPDNLAFDPGGNLWMVTDMSASGMHQGPYQSFGNNGLFYIPMSGPNAGKPFQVGSAPRDAELTGLSFSPPDRQGKTTLFLSVQHPGESSPSLDQLTSHWPDGGTSIPKSAVVSIQGPLLEQLLRQPG